MKRFKYPRHPFPKNTICISYRLAYAYGWFGKTGTGWTIIRMNQAIAIHRHQVAQITK